MSRILSSLLLFILVGTAAAATTTTTTAPVPRKVQTIAVQIPTAAAASAELPPEIQALALIPEKFERFETPAGQPPTFSGNVIGIPPGKRAQVGVVANLGTQWIQPKNYKYAKVAPDGAFSITADHKPDAIKSLMVTIDGRLATFLRADFAPNESAKDVELRLSDAKTIVLTMENPQGADVRGFQVEAFTAYAMQDDAGQQNLRMQRVAATSSSAGAIVLEAPLEPVAVLLASTGLAPCYRIIDPRQADEFHFKMLAASRVRGIVTRNGKPVAGAQMYMVNPAAALSATLRKTDPQGRFDIGGRPPGRQQIRVAG